MLMANPNIKITCINNTDPYYKIILKLLQDRFKTDINIIEDNKTNYIDLSILKDNFDMVSISGFQTANNLEFIINVLIKNNSKETMYFVLDNYDLYKDTIQGLFTIPCKHYSPIQLGIADCQNRNAMLEFKTNRNKVYVLFNIWHLGDSIFNMMFFHYIKDYIEANNIIIQYYVRSCYTEEIKLYVPSENIELDDMDENYLMKVVKNNNTKDLFQLWIGNTEDFDVTNHPEFHRDAPYDEFLKLFFNETLEKLNIPMKMDKFEYNDPNLLTLYDTLHDKYKDIDILIINSIPLSKQYHYVESEWETYINKLNKLFNIVTTKKVDGVKCTLDDNCTTRDIAAISTKAKVIIAINTGPFAPLLNTYTLNNVRKVFIFDQNRHYSYAHFENKNKITEISIDELKSLICR